MKALENSSETTPQTLIPISGYGSNSTITLNELPNEPTSTWTLANMANPSTSLPQDGQIINRTVVEKIQTLQDRTPSDGPESSEVFEKRQIASSERALSNLREASPRVLGRAVVKIRSLLSSTIEFAPPPDKFSQPQLKYFCGDSNPDYHIMHYRNVMALYSNNDVPLHLGGTSYEVVVRVWQTSSQTPISSTVTSRRDTRLYSA